MRKYILFGAGKDGRYLLKLLGKERVAYFCDNDTSLQGLDVDGVKVLSYDNLRKVHEMYSVVIASRKLRNCCALAVQLTQDGIPFRLMEEVATEGLEKDKELYQVMNPRETLSYQEKYAYLIPYDKYGSAGTINSYFWQDIWAAQHIYRLKPAVHYDIGSRIDGFIAHLSTFGQKVRLLDIRPLGVVIPNVEFIQCDATNLASVADNSIESLSALCSLEHFGLGRYGDAVDPEACFRCFAAIQRKVMPGGAVYISVPIGKEHVEFNAHRVFFASTIRECFSEMDLVEFSSVYREQYECNVDLHKYDTWIEWGGERFGLFAFKK